MRYRIRAAMTAVLAGCSYLSAPQACEGPGLSTCADLAEVEVVDRGTGEKLPVYWHDGQRWIAGTPGHRYWVGLRNHSPGRILGVVSVDGVNAISGATANWSQGGYVLGPWQSFDVLGWRKSLNHVADFVFTAVADSYAARTGRADNAGVIGVALFREAPAAPSAPVSVYRSEQADGAGAAGSAPAPSAAARATLAPDAQLQEQRLGTGHGPTETSIVLNTDFRRAQAQPDQIVSIRYDRRERLVAMGILAPPAPGPQPFPVSADVRFVADPPARMR